MIEQEDSNTNGIPMIKEAYVSFEVAKLLKEKGFEQSTQVCNTVYKPNGMICNNARSFISPSYILKDFYVFAPTQQMAMAWLRKVHNIHISINPYTDKEGHNFHFLFYKYGYGCWQELGIYILDSYETPEQAIEAALKCCLTYLN